MSKTLILIGVGMVLTGVRGLIYGSPLEGEFNPADIPLGFMALTVGIGVIAGLLFGRRFWRGER